MKQKQIRTFLDSILPGIKFNFKFGSNFQCLGSPACVDMKCLIWLNKDTFRLFSERSQKGILMHEVGHIVAGLYKSEVDTEFFAQLMAIGLAKKNSWTYLVKELEATFAEWADFKWNEKHGAFRRYILAGRKYKCLREKLKLN